MVGRCALVAERFGNSTDSRPELGTCPEGTDDAARFIRFGPRDPGSLDHSMGYSVRCVHRVLSTHAYSGSIHGSSKASLDKIAGPLSPTRKTRSGENVAAAASVVYCDASSTVPSSLA